MAAKIEIVMFCSNAGVSASAPRKAAPNLVFTLPPKSDKIDDDNLAVFGDANQRGASFSIQNVAPGTIEQFLTAPRVRVTIEAIEE